MIISKSEKSSRSKISSTKSHNKNELGGIKAVNADLQENIVYQDNHTSKTRRVKHGPKYEDDTKTISEEGL